MDFKTKRSMPTGDLNRPAGLMENPNFRRWFGDSKAVDLSGAPLVLYHGTASEFSEFSIGEAWGEGEAGAFFSGCPKAVEEYAKRDGGNILPVFLSIQNPYETTADEWDSGESSSIDAVKSQGLYDGYVIRGWAGHDDAWVAFYPDQIKSAIGNRGRFDRNNPGITE